MISQLGVLVHIDFSPKTCFFIDFGFYIPVSSDLGYFSAYFPKLLLCYSLYSYFLQEPKKKKIEPIEKEETAGASDHNQVMQDPNNPSFSSKLKGSNQFSHSDEGLHSLKEISQKMKMNFGKFGKNANNIKKSEKDEPKSLLSSISTQLMYILLNSHQPLQMKMDELLVKIQDKMKSTLNLDPNSSRAQKSVCVRCGSDDTPITPTACECGEEAEYCRCQDLSFVPILLNHSFAKNESILVPLEGEEEIYPTRKAVRSVK